MGAAGFDAVRKIGREFPGVVEAVYYGQPALKLRGKMVVCMAAHRSAEPDSLVVRMDFERRTELLEEAPDRYYLTDHYVDYPSVLVRLAKVREEELRGLIAGAVKAVGR